MRITKKKICASTLEPYKYYYTGYGYPSTSEILSEANNLGYTKYFWASDTNSEYKGLYNGDTIVVYRNAKDLPEGVREDANRFGAPIIVESEDLAYM